MLLIPHAMSLNVRFLNGGTGTYYVEPHNCLVMAHALSHACEWVALYLNDSAYVFNGDTYWFADMLDGMPE